MTKTVQNYINEFKKHYRYSPTNLGKIERIENYIKTLEKRAYECKLKQTKKVFDKIAYLINTNETCTYRFLIYDLLGFDCDAYVPLISGLTITNMLCDYQDYKLRNEKAIEYIKNKQELNKMFGTITLSKDSQNELLNILGGDDNE